MDTSSAIGTSLTAVALGAGSYLITKIPWAAIFILTHLFGIGMYNVSSKDIAKRIQRRVRYASHREEDGKAVGYCVGRWFVLCITRKAYASDAEYDVHLLATAATYEALTAEDETAPSSVVGEAPKPVQKKSLTIWQRMGSYYGHSYRKRTVSLVSVTPRDSQQAIMDRIITHHRDHEHAVAFIYGPPGTGKSMLGPLLTHHYCGSFCNSLKPWEPNNNIASLYEEAHPTHEKPLILAFDEVDNVLMMVHTGITPHKNLPTAIMNKSGWNQLFDEINRGMYPHLIVIMTSNRPPEFIQSMDASYIRPGRVDICAELA